MERGAQGGQNTMMVMGVGACLASPPFFLAPPSSCRPRGAGVEGKKGGVVGNPALRSPPFSANSLHPPIYIWHGPGVSVFARAGVLPALAWAHSQNSSHDTRGRAEGKGRRRGRGWREGGRGFGRNSVYAARGRGSVGRSFISSCFAFIFQEGGFGCQGGCDRVRGGKGEGKGEIG